MSTTNNESAVTENIKKARRMLYSFLAVGLHGENGHDPETSLHLYGNGSFRSYSRLDPGSFRSYSLSVRSFWPGSFRPDFRGGSFRPNFGGSFRPTLFYIVFRS